MSARNNILRTILIAAAMTAAMAAALAAFSACQRIETEQSAAAGGRSDSEPRLVLTATIAEDGDDASSKATYSETSTKALKPTWEVGDKVVGWDSSGNTYGFEVAQVNETTKVATMQLITSGTGVGTFASGTPADGTVIHLVYAPGKKPSDVSGQTLVYDLSTQAADVVPALMSASAVVSKDSSDGSATMSAVFHNKTVVLAIKTPTMDAPGFPYTSITVSGATSTTLLTQVTFSISGGGLKATYGTGGTITKNVSFTSDATSKGPDATYIVLSPQTTATTLFFQTNNFEQYSLTTSRTYAAGTYNYLNSPVFQHPYVEINGIKWATMNIGASTVADSPATCYGNYYFWGAAETVNWSFPTANGTLSNWKSLSSLSSAEQSKYSCTGNFSKYEAKQSPYYSSSVSGNYTKYNSSDAKTVLEADDDAATANWGSNWRTPTLDDFKSLYKACGGNATAWAAAPTSGGTISTTAKGVYWCTNYNGVSGLNGILFVDESSNKIFLPVTGYLDKANLTKCTDAAETDKQTWYMMATLKTSPKSSSDFPKRTYVLFGQSANVSLTGYEGWRNWGLAVRPVRKN